MTSHHPTREISVDTSAGVCAPAGFRAAGVAAGFIAGAMHLAWSAGYWRERLSPAPAHEVPA